MWESSWVRLSCSVAFDVVSGLVLVLCQFDVGAVSACCVCGLCGMLIFQWFYSVSVLA